MNNSRAAKVTAKGNEYGFYKTKTFYENYATVKDVAGAIEVGAAAVAVVIAGVVLAADTKEGVTNEEHVKDLINNSNLE